MKVNACGLKSVGLSEVVSPEVVGQGKGIAIELVNAHTVWPGAGLLPKVHPLRLFRWVEGHDRLAGRHPDLPAPTFAERGQPIPSYTEAVPAAVGTEWVAIGRSTD